MGLALTEAIDMWSLGCLCARLYLGVQLYSGKNEYEMESIALPFCSTISLLSLALITLYCRFLKIDIREMMSLEPKLEP